MEGGCKHKIQWLNGAQWLPLTQCQELGADATNIQTQSDN